jgi:dipeptide/tripeptide permease
MTPSLAGTLVLALPALLLAYAVLWRRQRQVFWFAVALIAVGTGYLNLTGAAAEIGQRFVASTPAVQPASAR